MSSGVAALAAVTVSLFTLLFSQLFGQRNTTLERGGIVLELFGIVLLNLSSNLQASPADASLTLFAVALWAFGPVWSRYLSLPVGPITSVAKVLIGDVVLLIGSLTSDERLEHWPSTSGWLALVYLILFDSIIIFSAYRYLLRNVWPATTISYAYVNPTMAVLLGTLFTSERIDGIEGLAMPVIISTVVLIGLPQWRVSRVVT